MDDLLREFLAETGEHLETVDVELVRLERDPSDAAILRNVFRLVHTIKGTCGFLGLPRLEGLAHAAETLMGQLREGKPITTDVVTLVLAAIDRIKLIIAELESLGAEPVGSDADLIAALEHASLADDVGDPIPGGQVLLRPLRPGEVPLHVLERAFRDAPGPIQTADGTVAAGRPAEAKAGPEERARPEMDGEHPSPRVQSVRVGIETLEQLMTTVSELVLTRNQLLDVARKTRDDSAFKGPLQRLSQVTAELQDGIMKTRMQPVGAAWAKLPRLLRDVSSELGKHIQLATTGADTEIDRQVLDLIRDPLTHMVRNSAAHGIESPAERLALGKPARGRITLAAYQEGGAIAIEVSDDGRGLDLRRDPQARPRDGARQRGRDRPHDRRPGRGPDLPSGLLDGGGRQFRIRPRCRHGCREDQRRASWRDDRDLLERWPRDDIQGQASPHARHRTGPDRQDR
jgi:two-component system chemotaxis sensor kinase CheA